MYDFYPGCLKNYNLKTNGMINDRLPPSLFTNRPKPSEVMFRMKNRKAEDAKFIFLLGLGTSVVWNLSRNVLNVYSSRYDL